MNEPRTPEPPYPAQRQEPPGVEGAMRPAADHGEGSYRGHGRLLGRGAIVTGGDSGIGRAVALAFAREGADVLISYLSEHEDARESVRLVEDAGRRAVAMAGDVGDVSHCAAIVDRAMAEFERLDILVNNAAYQQVHDSITEHPAEEIEHIFRTNILAMFWLCQAAVPHMGAGGAIINTASIQAYEPSPTLLPYATTKGAIVTFTKGLAQELDPEGDPGQRRRAGAGVDAADPDVDARGADRAVRGRHADGPDRSARRAGPAVRVPRLRRGAVRVRRDPRRHRRQAHRLSWKRSPPGRRFLAA